MTVWCDSWTATVIGTQPSCCHSIHRTVQNRPKTNCKKTIKKQGRSQGAREHALNRRMSGFFNRKNWLCLDVWPALFSKVTLFSLPEVFCGPQIYEKYYGRRWKFGGRRLKNSVAPGYAPVKMSYKRWDLGEKQQQQQPHQHSTIAVWPRVGPGYPLPPCPFISSSFPPFCFSISFIGFTYFLLLSIPSLSTRIVPLRFQAGGRRRRPNLGLVCV